MWLALIIPLTIIVVFVLLKIAENTCYFGHHWYVQGGCYMSRPTGAKHLPGNFVYPDWQRPNEDVGYRFERHCLRCAYEEYSSYKDGKQIWKEVPKNQGY